MRVGITIGDPSGIGPEITAKAVKALAGINAQFVVIGKAPRRNFSFGKIRAEYGKASMEYLDQALKMIQAGEIDCLVTCPISKEAINLAGLKYSGHTEYFAQKTKSPDCVMMLLNDKLKISLVTRHIPLKDVPKALTQNKLNKTISLTYEALKKLFSISEPRVVVCGLNPHASDNGLLGKEEERVIIPVIKKLRNCMKIDGPLSADVAMFKANQGKYDAVIAIYHDQALIPLKLTGADSGVNLTLGLPFIRTSPLHGTGFDIAGKGKADPSSLIQAIKVAIKCSSGLKKV